jgi:hypothetical protein
MATQVLQIMAEVEVEQDQPHLDLLEELVFLLPLQEFLELMLAAVEVAAALPHQLQVVLVEQVVVLKEVHL